MDNEDPDLELLQNSSSDMNEMSDDFLSMLNTDCKTSDIEEFNSWFQDNIIPDVCPLASESILDTLCTDGELNTRNYDLLQCDANITSQYYNGCDEMMPLNMSQGCNTLMDGNYIAPFSMETPPRDKRSPHTNPISHDNTRRPDKLECSTNAHETKEIASTESENNNSYFIKETYYQDDSGNTFIEQEYLKREDFSDQKQKPRFSNVGSKRPRACTSDPQKKDITYSKEYIPQKTVIRPVQAQMPSKIPESVNSQNLGYIKPLQVQVKTETNTKNTPCCTQSAPQTVPLHQKTRILIPNKGQKNSAALVTALPPKPQSIPPKTSPNTSPTHISNAASHRVLYVSSRGRSDKPVTSHKSSVPPVPSSVTNQSHNNNAEHTTTLKDERLSPTSTVINEWEQSINDPPSVVGNSITFHNGRVQIHKGPVQVKSAVLNPTTTALQQVPKGKPTEVPKQVATHNKAPDVARTTVTKQIKNNSTPKHHPNTNRSVPSKEINHISIQGKPGLVDLKKGEPPANLIISKPINSTKPIIKEPQQSVIEEEEPEEKRTNHNAVERKYRYSINDKILELKQMLVPKDTKIQKSGVLRKAIEHINTLQNTILKLKQDNMQLKKKQDILEKNNNVLTLKLAEQGAHVVYLDKTPDLVEPPGLYSTEPDAKETELSPKSDDSCGDNSPSRKSPLYTYQHSLPDSPESLRQSDGESRHIRSNSGSSGGYSSAEEVHLVKKPRYTIENSAVHHRDQRTIPMLCMVFMFGLFIPSLLPRESIASSTFGRSLLSVSKSHDYITPLIQVIMMITGFVITTTLSYLFFVIKSKVVIKDETLLKTKLREIKQSIKKGDEGTAQSDLEHILCNVGVRVFHNKLSYNFMIVEYMLSILPHNRVVHWLCCNNSTVLSDMLLNLSHLQASKKVKRYEDWSSLCYALQASRYNITSTNVYIALSLAVKKSIAKAHFYRRSNRRDNRWISCAKEFIFSKKLTDIPLGEGVSTSLELQYTQELVCRAARALILSGEGTVERKQTAGTLVKQALPSLAYLRKEYPSQVKEMYWLIDVLEAYQASEEEIRILKFNETSEITRIISSVYKMTQDDDVITEQDMSDVIERLFHITDTSPPSLYKVVLCGAVDWLLGLQISQWRKTEEVVSVLQKSNFRRSIQLLELLGEGEEEYKVSLYTAVHRVMCQANPTLTRRHLHNVLHPDKPAVNNLEQVLAIEVCMKYVPSLLLPSKDTLVEHMNVFLRSLD